MSRGGWVGGVSRAKVLGWEQRGGRGGGRSHSQVRVPVLSMQMALHMCTQEMDQIQSWRFRAWLDHSSTSICEHTGGSAVSDHHSGG